MQQLFKVFEPSADYYTPSKLSEGPILRLFNDILRFRVASEESFGQLLIMEVLSPAGGGAPPIHTHPMHEMFYLQEGELDIDYLDHHEKKTMHLKPGEMARVQYQIPHTYANRSDKTAHFFTIYTPPGGIDEFFKCACTPIEEFAIQPLKTPTDEEVKRVVEIAEQFGIQFIK